MTKKLVDINADLQIASQLLETIRCRSVISPGDKRINDLLLQFNCIVQSVSRETVQALRRNRRATQ